MILRALAFSLLSLAATAAFAQIDEPGRGETASQPSASQPAATQPTIAPAGHAAAALAEVERTCSPGPPCASWAELVRLTQDQAVGARALQLLERLGDPRGAHWAAHAAVYGASPALRAAGRRALETLAARPSARLAVWHIARNDPDHELQRATRAALGPAAVSLLEAAPPVVGRTPPPPLDPDWSRMVFGSTARSRSAGHGAWIATDVSWHGVEYGITDNVQIGISGVVPIGIVALVPHLKLSTELAPGVHGALIAQGAFIFPYIADDDDLLIGVYGGAALLSFGERQLQVTLGAHAYGVTVSEDEYRYVAAPVVPGAPPPYPSQRQVTEHRSEWFVFPTVGLSWRFHRKLMLNLEVYAPLGSLLDEEGLNGRIWAVLYGLRLFGQHIFGDIGFVIPIFPDADEILKYAPIGFPLLSFGYRW